MKERTPSGPILVAAVVWLVMALLVGALGLVATLRPPLPQVVLFSLVALLILAFWGSPRFRAWALTVDVRVLVLIHVSRFVGIYFLVLYTRGELPYAFAVPGGWGDITVAATALALTSLSRTSGRASWTAYFAWNALGMVDILLVVATAARLALASPASMAALLRLPLSLLPTFLVPIIIFTHVVIFVRLLASRREGYGPV